MILLPPGYMYENLSKCFSRETKIVQENLGKFTLSEGICILHAPVFFISPFWHYWFVWYKWFFFFHMWIKKTFNSTFTTACRKKFPTATIMMKSSKILFYFILFILLLWLSFLLKTPKFLSWDHSIKLWFQNALASYIYIKLLFVATDGREFFKIWFKCSNFGLHSMFSQFRSDRMGLLLFCYDENCWIKLSNHWRWIILKNTLLQINSMEISWLYDSVSII